MEKLLNVHEIVQDAMFNKNEHATETITVRITKSVKDASQGILKEHGVTQSRFLRTCLETLVKDYVVAPITEEEAAEEVK